MIIIWIFYPRWQHLYTSIDPWRKKYLTYSFAGYFVNLKFIHTVRVSVHLLIQPKMLSIQPQKFPKFHVYLPKESTSKTPKSPWVSRQHLASLLCNEHRMLELRRPFGIFGGHRPAIRPGDPFICAFSQDRFDGKSGAQLHLPGGQGTKAAPRCVCQMWKTHLSHEKNPYYFPLYWLVNRDPYNGLL